MKIQAGDHSSAKRKRGRYSDTKAEAQTEAGEDVYQKFCEQEPASSERQDRPGDLCALACSSFFSPCLYQDGAY